MSLFGALNIGSSALSAQQTALQVTGNNIANSGNANYSREVADLSPSPSQQIQPGIFLGSGVTLTDIQRQVDESLNTRLRSSVSDNQSATTTQTWMSQVESSFNALGTNNISTQMSTFFGDWSRLANAPQDAGLRQVVLSDGSNVAQSLSAEQTQLTTIQGSTQQQIGSDAQTADGYAQQLANLNSQIATASDGPSGQDNSLLDQRDTILTNLSKLMNIQTVVQADGAVNVYVGSQPLVDATVSKGVTVQQQTVNNVQVSTVVFKSNGGPLPLTSGELGSLQTLQLQVSNVSNQVDGLAHNLIAAVNQLHASGQGTTGFTSVTGTNAVKSATAALNSPAAGMNFPPTNGSFVIHVTNSANGLGTSTLV